MTIYMPSTPGFAGVRFGLETNTQRFTSPLNRSTQRVLLGGARWTANYTLPTMNRSDAAKWQAFLMQLEGGVNTFYAHDPDAVHPQGDVSGSAPLVDGGSQTGSTLSTDGWKANTLVLKAGDYFTVNSELKMVTANVTSDGSGDATINFKPALRTSPSNNAALNVVKASCEMVLIDDQQTQWSSGTRLGVYEGITFSAMEAFS